MKNYSSFSKISKVFSNDLNFFFKKFSFQINKFYRHSFFIKTSSLPINKKEIFVLKNLKIYKLYKRNFDENFLNFFIKLGFNKLNRKFKLNFYFNLLFLFFRRSLINLKLIPKLSKIKRKCRVKKFTYITLRITKKNTFVNFLMNGKTVYKINKGRFLNLNSSNYIVPLRRRRKLGLPKRIRSKEKLDYKYHLLFLDYLKDKLNKNPISGYYHIEIKNSFSDLINQKVLFNSILSISKLNAIQSNASFMPKQCVKITEFLFSYSVSIFNLLNIRLLFLKDFDKFSLTPHFFEFKNTIKLVKKLIRKIKKMYILFHRNNSTKIIDIGFKNCVPFNSVSNNRKLRRI